MVDFLAPWGNDVVIELLEVYLEAARQKPIGGIAISAVGYPRFGACDYAGHISLEKAQLECLDRLREKVAGSIRNWEFPEQDPSLDASYVRYNMVNGSLGFDFLVWLVSQEMTRVREGAPAPLKVGFWQGLDPEKNMQIGGRLDWLNNVFRPLLQMIGAVEDDRALRGRCSPVFVPIDISRAARAGEPVPRLRPVKPWNSKAPGVWGDEAPDITITLREKDSDPWRNSTLAEWLAAADEFEGDGLQVVFLRDAAKADQPLRGFRTCPAASKNMHVRMALYEAAGLNFFGENGPASMGWFGSRPYIQFALPCEENDRDMTRRPSFWEKSFGIKVGEQFPWALPSQRIAWAADTCDNIVSAYRENRRNT